MSGPNGNKIRHPAPDPQVQIDPAAPLDGLLAQFEALRDANVAKLQDLSRQGLEMDPLSLLHVRIDRLIDSIAQFAGPHGPRWMLMARLSFEQHLAAELETAEAQGRKAQLAQGASWTPGMIAELARQTGLFRRRT